VAPVGAGLVFKAWLRVDHVGAGVGRGCGDVADDGHDLDGRRANPAGGCEQAAAAQGEQWED
jgi:hypothetical protein